MKFPIIIVILFAAVVLALPHQQQKRISRKVSEEVSVEPQNVYLPPDEPSAPQEAAFNTSNQTSTIIEAKAAAVAEAEVAATEVTTPMTATPETAQFGENGYEYRTIRKLRLRQRRDVSHLNRDYLPPLAKIPKLELNYLPPHLDVPQQEMAKLKISNEYLPPVKGKFVLKEQKTEAPAETEEPVTETATTEMSTSQVTQSITTEAGTMIDVISTTAAATPPESTTPASNTEAPQSSATILKEALPVESAILAQDGYHYRRPAVLPNLGISDPLIKVATPQSMASEYEQQYPKSAFAQYMMVVEMPQETIHAEPELAYLPPIDSEVVEIEGPDNESSAFLNDGYHYRVVKSIRVF